MTYMYTLVRLMLLAVMLIFATACTEEEDTTSKVLAVSQAQIPIQIKPDFSWPAFLRFWHRGAHEKVDINAAKRADGGYSHDFGYGVTLQVHMYGDLIGGATLQFVALEGNDSGGIQFMRTMQHMMRIGTYGWDMDKRDILYKYYEVMSPEIKEFIFTNSYFVRKYDAKLKLWTFALFFVQAHPQMKTLPPIKDS